MAIVSVIIPTYNQRGLLKETINSVLQQSLKDFELIVVDDNNPDTPARESTETIMRQFENDPRVKYIKHEHNKNGSAARNTGFRASKGKYIAFLDDDDSWEECKLQRQIDYLKENPMYDAVYCFTYVRGKAKNPNRCLEGNIAVEYLTNYVSLQTSCVMFTRKAVSAINGFDESFKRHQDYEFLLRFFFAGFKIGCIPEYLSIKGAGGGNGVSGLKFEEVKEKFLSTFSKQFDELDRITPGIKKKIIVANYAKVFESHMAGKNYKLAYRVFKRYFPISPLYFIKQCLLLLSNNIRRKFQRIKNSLL